MEHSSNEHREQGTAEQMPYSLTPPLVHEYALFVGTDAGEHTLLPVLYTDLPKVTEEIKEWIESCRGNILRAIVLRGDASLYHAKDADALQEIGFPGVDVNCYDTTYHPWIARYDAGRRELSAVCQKCPGDFNKQNSWTRLRPVQMSQSLNIYEEARNQNLTQKDPILRIE